MGQYQFLKIDAISIYSVDLKHRRCR